MTLSPQNDLIPHEIDHFDKSDKSDSRARRASSGKVVQEHNSAHFSTIIYYPAHPIILSLLSMNHPRQPIDSMSNPFSQSFNPQPPNSNNYVPYNYHNNYVESPSIHKKQPTLSDSHTFEPT